MNSKYRKPLQKKNTQKVLTEIELKKIAKSFDKAREKSMRKNNKDSMVDFVEV